MRITAVTCVKNEGAFLLEWIAFHRMIGVTDFLFYSNDCTDGTDRLLDALARQGGVVHLPNPAQGRNYQMEALKDAARQPVVQQADWVWVADVDEFLNIHAPGHSIPALIAASAQAGDGPPQSPCAISLHFQFFANAGIDAFEDVPVIAQFTKTHNPDIWGSEIAQEVKTLVRKDFPLQYFGAHRPFVARKRSLPAPWTDGSGRPVPEAFLTAAHSRRIRKFPARGARRFATLNHYALRSLDSYLVKNDRGDVNRENRAFDDTYWRDRNDTAWEDRSILRHLPKLQDAMAEMMTDPLIAALHTDCVARHKAQRDLLLSRPEYVEMQAQLRQAGTLPAQEARLRKELGYKA